MSAVDGELVGDGFLFVFPNLGDFKFLMILLVINVNAQMLIWCFS